MYRLLFRQRFSKPSDAPRPTDLDASPKFTRVLKLAPVLCGLLVGVAVADDATPTAPGETAANTAARPVAVPRVSAKMVRYAKRIIAKYDADGDGQLQPTEWSAMKGQPANIDTDGDGVISVEDYARHVAQYGRYRRILLQSPQIPDEVAETTSGQPGDASSATDDVEKARRNKKFYVPAARLPQGLSQAFLNRDVDGDGQLTLAEFAPQSNPAEVERFRRLDANLDGVVTAQEYVRGPQPVAAPPATEPAPPQ